MRTAPLFSSASDRWATPRAVYAALDSEFGFDFDPCPLDGDGDGLSPLFCSWSGKRVFCNPPYGPGLREWLKRGLEAELAVFLIPARTDTRWFHEIVLPKAAEIRFVKGRLKFGESKTSAPFPSIIVVFKRRTSQEVESMLTLKLPYPPSVNHYWRSVRGRVLISREGRDYREAVRWMLLSQNVVRQVGRLCVEVDIHPPDHRRRDLDNTQKSLLDALAHGGAYNDDSQIDRLVVTRCEVTRGGRAVVRIKTL